jgi:hypothetical protein
MRHIFTHHDPDGEVVFPDITSALKALVDELPYVADIILTAGEVFGVGGVVIGHVPTAKIVPHDGDAQVIPLPLLREDGAVLRIDYDGLRDRIKLAFGQPLTS